MRIRDIGASRAASGHAAAAPPSSVINSSLRSADLTKADLTGTCLFGADVAGARFSDDVDRNMLKKACILKQDWQQQRTELNTTSQSLAEFSEQIPNCDGLYRCKNDLWDSLSPD